MATRMKIKRMPRPDDSEAFIDDVRPSRGRARDDDAESLGEEFVASVTSGDNVFEAARDELVEGDLSAVFADAQTGADEEELEVAEAS